MILTHYRQIQRGCQLLPLRNYVLLCNLLLFPKEHHILEFSTRILIILLHITRDDSETASPKTSNSMIVMLSMEASNLAADSCRAACELSLLGLKPLGFFWRFPAV